MKIEIRKLYKNMEQRESFWTFVDWIWYSKLLDEIPVKIRTDVLPQGREKKKE
jgi:hypothetical protein